MKRTTSLLLIIVFLAILATPLLWFALQLEEYDRVTSPDTRFYAVAEYRAYHAWLSGMPGGSGDKPGKISLYTADGRLVDKTPVEMVSKIQEIRWTATSASIPAAADWHLPVEDP